MDAEAQFIRDNIPPITVDGSVVDQPLSFTYKTKDKTDATSDAKDSKTLFASFEKLTPDNFFDRVTATERSVSLPR